MNSKEGNLKTFSGFRSRICPQDGKTPVLAALAIVPVSVGENRGIF